MKRLKLQLNYLIALAAVFVASGCGNSLNLDSFGDLQDGESDQSVIVGDVDWVSVTNFEDSDVRRIKANAVGFVSMPASQGRCTGFLISEDIVMTNKHCVGSQAGAKGVTVEFRYEEGTRFGRRDKYDCSTLLGNNADLDYALLRCSGKPGLKNGYLNLEARDSARSGDSMYLIHQNCNHEKDPKCFPSKKFSPGVIDRISMAGNDIIDGSTGRKVRTVYYTADMLGGSSGSPVFSSDSNNVFALNNIEVRGSGQWWINRGVSMEEIIPDIKARFPSLDIPSLREDSGDNNAPSDNVKLDKFEPNNTRAEGIQVFKNLEESGLNIHDPNDKDVFKLIVKENSDVDIMAEFEHNKGDLDTVLYAEDGTTVIKSSKSAKDEENISITDLAKGNYFLVIYGYKDATNEYDLNISIKSLTPDEPDTMTPDEPDTMTPDAPMTTVDPGSNASTALTVTAPHSSSQRISARSDIDVFRANLMGSREVRIDFDLSEGDLDMYFFNATGKLMAKSVGTDKNFAKITLSNGNGYYYIGVFGKNGATADYTISIQ